MITPVVNRTLHTYHNTLRLLCEAFQIEFEGRDHHCERLLVQQAFNAIELPRPGPRLVLPRCHAPNQRNIKAARIAAIR